MAQVMSASEFHSKSSKFFSTGRSAIVKDIERLLKLYHRSGDNPRRQLKILVLVYIWCRQYQAGGGTRGGVSDLVEQVKAELPRMEMALQLSHQGARWKEGSMQIPSGNEGKSMGQGYRMEPYLPGKGSVGGVQLKHQVKRINTPVLRGLFEDDIEHGLQHSGAQYTMNDVVHQAEEAMKTASIAELLDVYFNFTQSDAYSQRADFEYCNKDQRQRYLVHINAGDGCFYQDERFTTPYSTDPSPNQQDWGLFAFDMDCRLYVKPQRDFGDGQFNHSSFLSGKPVICAGAIEIDPGGHLRNLSNESGHYRPTPGDLAHMLDILAQQYNVNTNGVTVHINSAQGKQQLNGTACRMQFANASRSRISDVQI